MYYVFTTVRENSGLKKVLHCQVLPILFSDYFNCKVLFCSFDFVDFVISVVVHINSVAFSQEQTGTRQLISYTNIKKPNT